MPFGNAITGGQGALLRTAIKSPNYVPGVSGWSINRDGTAEFSGGQFRGAVLIGVSPNPRIELTTTIPAPLVAASADFVWSAAQIQYYDLNTFYFNAVGTYLPGPWPIQATGSYDGVDVLFHAFYEGPGSPTPDFIRYGSDVYNPTRLNFFYNNGAVTIATGSTLSYGVGSNLLIDVPSAAIAYGTISTLTTLSDNAGTEKVFAVTDWDLVQDPQGVFQDGWVYRVTVQCGIFSGVGAFNNSMAIRIRQGAATTTGTILAEWGGDPWGTTLASRCYTGFFQNATGADITTALSLTMVRNGGAQTVNLRADTTRHLTVVVDRYARPGHSEATVVNYDMT